MSFSFLPKLIPNRSFGSVALGDDLSKYITRLNLVKTISAEKDGDWDTYEVLGKDVSIDVEQGRIVAMSVRDECIYRGHNLIGKNVYELEEILQASYNQIDSPVVYQNGEMHVCADYDSLGLQIWFHKDVVVNVAMSDGSIE